MQAMVGSRPDVLPAQAVQLAHRPRVGTGRLYGGALRQATSEASYGLGWRSFTYGGRRLEGHSGAVAGYRATMIFDPATRTGVVALWNSDWGFPVSSVEPRGGKEGVSTGRSRWCPHT